MAACEFISEGAWIAHYTRIYWIYLLKLFSAVYATHTHTSTQTTQNHASVIVNGTCQIPDATYKLVGSIICFYIPLGVMLITYCLTVRTLAKQRQNLGGNQQPYADGPFGSNWLYQAPSLGELRMPVRSARTVWNLCANDHTLSVLTLNAKHTQHLFPMQSSHADVHLSSSTERRCTWRNLLKNSLPSTPSHAHSATSTDTELSNLDAHELWLPESR